MSDELCGKSFETICNLPRGHKHLCSFESEPAAPAQASGTMSKERWVFLQHVADSKMRLDEDEASELVTEIRCLRSPDQRTLAAYQQGLEDGRSVPAQIGRAHV